MLYGRIKQWSGE